MINPKLRADFPMIENNPGMIYLDNAATTLKPRAVIDAMDEYYEKYTSNTGRGSHRWTQKASQKLDESRGKIAKFVGARENEIVLTRNATEGINLVAVSLERMGHFRAGDEIVVTIMEHHANLIPWQQLCNRTGAKLKVAALNPDFTLDMNDLQEKVTPKTKMVSIPHASNTVASIQPVKEIGKIAHDAGALYMVDGAQSVPHMETNVLAIGCDFLAFSGHKMAGPTGIGVLFGREELLAKMPPYNFGGGMIKKVTIEKTDFENAPQKFEAGTHPIAEAIGLAEAARYLKKIGMENIREHDKKLAQRCIEKFSQIDGLTMHCPKNAQKQAGIVLFGTRQLDAVDLAVALDESKKIAIRSGMHCAEPIIRSINQKGLARASFYLYNTLEEIDTLANEVTSILRAFK